VDGSAKQSPVRRDTIARRAGRGYRTGPRQGPEREGIKMAGENLKEITDSNFQSEIVDNAGLSMVDFWAEWCGPCRLIAPFMEQLAGEYAGRLTVGKLNVDNSPRTSAQFNVRSIPTVLFFKDGQLVDTVVGAVPKQALDRKIQELLVA
jgi:thioredoxin 1